MSPVLLRSDKGLAFTSHHYTRLVRNYGLTDGLITPHCPQQNGLVERIMRKWEEQCVHRQRFHAQQQAIRIIADWIDLSNDGHPSQLLEIPPSSACSSSLACKDIAGSLHQVLGNGIGAVHRTVVVNLK